MALALAVQTSWRTSGGCGGRWTAARGTGHKPGLLNVAAIPLRELQLKPALWLRRVEEGERLTVTVSRWQGTPAG